MVAMTPESLQTTDETFLQRALDLACEANGLASPNPTVGCVLARDGQTLGEGAHQYDRFDHAEIVALKQAAAAGHTTNRATAYVTLEPCSHHGRTAPCADALIAAAFARSLFPPAVQNPPVRGTALLNLGPPASRLWSQTRDPRRHSKRGVSTTHSPGAFNPVGHLSP